MTGSSIRVDISSFRNLVKRRLTNPITSFLRYVQCVSATLSAACVTGQGEKLTATFFLSTSIFIYLVNICKLNNFTRKISMHVMCWNNPLFKK
jgi:hypothetical protein